jgi:protein-S-isoprenylcysteine O-methyltransferase Ste14
MDVFALVVTLVVLAGVVVFILMFESQRATRIERDLRSAPPDPNVTGRRPQA